MTRSPRSVLHALALLLVAACPACGPAADDAPERPNFLFLLTDDQTHDSLSCAGSDLIRTPGIDRLADEGVRFANAFVTTSLCSPARASFLTGLYVRSHGVLDNSTPLADLPNVASLLRDEGYATAWFGKWHLGSIHEGELPGFDRAVGYRAQGKYRDCLFYVDGREQPTEGFVDDVTCDLAIEFLREQGSEPFFLGVGFKAPHGPRYPARRFREQFEGIEFPAPPNLASLPPWPRQSEWNRLSGGDPTWTPAADWAVGFGERKAARAYDEDRSEALRDYLRLIAGIDEGVGRLLEALDELGLARDTVVVYASDNGYGNGQHGVGGKRSAYEESMRVALIVRDPRQPETARGRVAEELALNVDLAPTLLELAGAEVPEQLHGVSLAPLVRGESVAPRSDFLYEYYREDGFSVPATLALRSERWKLITYPDYPEWTELFDLEADPFETRNLAGAPEQSARLTELAARLAELDGQLGPRPE